MSSSRQPAVPAAGSTSYHSAYRGSVSGPDGKFDHFLRHLDESHWSGGYWRFSSYEDDRWAHACGFSTPEQVLVAQDHSNEQYDDIKMRWIPGTNDSSMPLSLVGTAAHHLQTIYEVRQILGMSMSLQGQIPVYPVGDSVRLKQYWQTKYNIQYLPPIDPAFDPFPHSSTLESTTSTPHVPETRAGLQGHQSSSTRHPSRVSATSSSRSDANLPPRPPVSPITPSKVPVSPSTPPGTVVTSPSLRNTRSLPRKTPGSFKAQHGRPKPAAQGRPKAPAVLQAIPIASTPRITDPEVKVASVESPRTAEFGALVALSEIASVMTPLNASPVHQEHLGQPAADAPGNSSTVPMPPPSHTVDMYPGLPCIDCGQDEWHNWNCHIGNLKPMKNLTILDYRNLADSVKRFDPGPWTTHFDQSPEPEPEDYATRVQGMAEIIRNEDSYKNDTELHLLPDDLMILLWGLKTSPGVEVIQQ